MKVKTNIRAGAQNRKGSNDTTNDTSGSTSNVVYYPPVTRCVGI